MTETQDIAALAADLAEWPRLLLDDVATEARPRATIGGQLALLAIGLRRNGLVEWRDGRLCATETGRAVLAYAPAKKARR